jgi:hypothetical protein
MRAPPIAATAPLLTPAPTGRLLRRAAPGAALCLLPALAFAQTVPNGAVTLAWSTQEIVAATGAPSSLSPGVIEPGEGVHINLDISFAPPVGTQFQWQGQTATVLGWGYGLWQIIGDGATLGTFSRFALPAGIETLPALTSFVAHDVGTIQVFQPPLLWEPGTINPSNPFPNLLSFDWVPSTYAPRTVAFHSENGITAAVENALALHVDGQSLVMPGSIVAIHGSTGSIVIVPAPAAAPALLLASFLRRKRLR